mmetsp:Transcript_3106/g.8649  ORF Transcript_3106/g.8649 Transcript_3106/m.8649 type:complete len:577 (-) Transcript_3106:188-1918(-)
MEYPCSASAFKRMRAIGDFDDSGFVHCVSAMSTGETCRKSTPVGTCSKFSNIFVDGELAACVANTPVISDVDDAYGLVDGRITRTEGLQFDAVNIRMIETLSNSEIHMCIAYGNWREGELRDPDETTKSRKAKARITAASPLMVELKDNADATGQYIGDGTSELLVMHEHAASESSGFCVGPFLGDGSGLRAEFFDLNSTMAVNVQTFERVTNHIENVAQWMFAENRASSELFADGRTNGDDSVTIDVQPTCACGAEAPQLTQPLSSTRAIDAVDASSQCVKNATHCSCSEKPWTPLIQLDFSPNTCKLGAEKDGLSCSCPGTSLCEREETSPCSKLLRIGDIDDQGRVECQYRNNQTCSKALNSRPCSGHVSVFINGQSSGCAASAPVTSDVNDMYGLRDGSATVANETLLDYINIRAIQSTFDEELHVCVIYGNAAQGMAQFGSSQAHLRKEKAKLTAAFDINIELRDDTTDAYHGDGSREVFMSHSHFAYKTDGFCVGPLLGDGSGLRATFYDLNNTLGVNVQSYDFVSGVLTSRVLWTFADHVTSADLFSDGRANGDDSVTVDLLPSCACVT